MIGRPPTDHEIPAFLCVDVEPDWNQVPKGEAAQWTGYDALYPVVERLRTELAPSSGADPRFSWFFRMDPQIAQVAPSVDHAATGFGDRIDRLRARGDGFGLHVHALRYSDEWGHWVEDYADKGWNAHCTESAVHAFTGVFGAPPDRHRYGSGFVDNDYVAEFERLGARVDLTPERRSVSEPLRRALDAHLGDEYGRTGAIPDCTGMPLGAYRPAHDDPLRADDERGRKMVMVPLSAARARLGQPRWRRAAVRVKHGMRPHPWRVLYPHAKDRDPKVYWDDVGRSLRGMPRPYVCIAVRTNAAGDPTEQVARGILEHLPQHPLSARLRFVDPVETAPALVSPVARAGLD